MALTTAIALGTAAAGVYSANKQAQAAKSYANSSKYNPYDVSTPYGSASFNNGTATASLSPDQQALQNYLSSQGSGFLGIAGDAFKSGGVTSGMQDAYNQYASSVPGAPDYQTSTGSFLGPIAGLAQQQANNSQVNPYQGMQDQFGGASQGFLGQLGSFNPQALSGQYTQNLRDQAQPENQRAVNSTVQGLFNTGRLGSTGGADVLGRLADSQNQQDLGFQKAGMDYAGSEQSRIAGLASNFGSQSGMFGQMGDQFKNSSLNNAMGLANLYSGIDQQNFTNSFNINDLANTRTNQRFSNAMQMFGMGNQNVGLGLAAGGLGQGLLGQSQGIDQGLMNMIQLGGNLGSAQSNANSNAYAPLMGAQQNQANTYSNLFSGFLGGIGSAYGTGTAGQVGPSSLGVSNNMYSTPNPSIRMA